MRKHQLATSLFVLTLFLSASPAAAQRVPQLGPFEVEHIKFTGGEYKNETFRYLVLSPHDGYEAGKKYPLILFLHGAGERGDDPNKLLPHFPTQMAKPEWRKSSPASLSCPSAETESSG